MPCPVASALSVSAVLGGFYTLLVQDIRLRRLSWTILLTLIGSWIIYFTQGRLSSTRVYLDVASTVSVLAGGARVYFLIRHRGIVPPLHRQLTKLLHTVVPVVKSPTVLSLKIWLLCMVVGDIRGISDFSRTEYWVVSGLLVLAITYKCMHVYLAIRKKPSYPELENYAQETSALTCPLGFGCETQQLGKTKRNGSDGDALESIIAHASANRDKQETGKS